MVSLCGRGFDSLQLHPRKQKEVAEESAASFFVYMRMRLNFQTTRYTIDDFYFLKLSRYFSGDMWRCSLTYFPKKEVLEKPKMPEISLIDFVLERR